ncbi:MAG: penicillin-binding protein activator [Proteobacteria bacterium]|nr:penicillin-binding protein activator [Pseudomonadota bacterium]
MKIIIKNCLVLLLLLTWFAANPQIVFSAPSADSQRIALLLPLQGVYGESGQSIRDGFLAAFYQSLSYDSNPPTIQIIDTSAGNVVALYKQAITQRASMVVGPLSKEQALQLIQAPLPIPTLVLNTLSIPQNINNLYQLALAPEVEAKQVADKAYQDGKRTAVIVAPNDEWGARVAQAFLSEWAQLGGKVAGQTYYGEPNGLATQVSQLLHVDQSEQRSKDLKKILNQTNMRTIPYRRQDFDIIFLAAQPEMARQIRPLFNFYYASNIPIYATSHIYSGTPNPQLDQDLNGVKFCAMPWLIDQEKLPSILQADFRSIQFNFPQEMQKQPQLFALGVDSYYLAQQILSKRLVRENQGATGILKFQSDRKWLRELDWAQIVDGKPVLIANEKTDRPAS